LSRNTASVLVERRQHEKDGRSHHAFGISADLAICHNDAEIDSSRHVDLFDARMAETTPRRRSSAPALQRLH
jgi:hypothetical protein